MNGDELLNILSDIDPELVCSAENAAGTPRRTILRYCAACLVLIAAAALVLLAPTRRSSPQDTLPQLSIPADSFGGMGMEALMLRDISDISDSNPWTPDARLKTLPVYKNLAYSGAPGLPLYLSGDEMEARAEKVLQALCPSESAFITRSIDRESGMETSVTASTDSYRVDIDSRGRIFIRFASPVPLPEGYSLSSSACSARDAVRTIYYILEEYSDFLGFSSPEASTWADYHFDGQQNRRFSAYDSAGSLEQRILSFNFALASFGSDVWDEDTLGSISFGNLLDSAEKLGDYPIISAEDARALLLDGCFITTVPADYLDGGTISAGNIAKTELIYRSGYLDEIFMPYYRFYVKLTDTKKYSVDQADGLSAYGAFYVPAVDAAFISEMPVWNGYFN